MTSPAAPDPLDGIAIIGMSARLPGARHVAAFWTNLCNGTESISHFSDEELLAAGVDPWLLRQPGYVRARGAIDDIDMFDASFFALSPREAEHMDPQHRVFLEVAWECLEHAGYDADQYQGLIGVFAGLGMNMYLLFNLASHPDFVAAIGGVQLMIGNDKDHLSTRVAYKLNLKGPSLTLQTACSTSLVAVCQACQALLTHQCDMALAGGVALSVPERCGYLYREGGIASPDGHCRAFDARARGTVGGSGAGTVLLKRLEDALNDGDHVHAIIRGFAVNNDGSAKLGYTAPSVDGQAEVIAMAHAIAGIDAGAISYVETHGTGTPLGDPIELAALTRAFRTSASGNGRCGIGSVKTNIGHLDAAAGIAGLIKTTLALEHRLVPPSLHFERTPPDVDLALTPFFVNTTLSRWSGPSPLRAGVSSFGIGGTNAHVVLEEAPVLQRTDRGRSSHLLVLSARTPAALASSTANLAAHLDAHPDLDLADTAYTLQVGRKAFAWRTIVIADDTGQARTALARRTSGQAHTATAPLRAPSIVFMFPGQGSQHEGMAQALYDGEATFRDEVDRASDLLEPLSGFDLRRILFSSGADGNGSADRLRQTSTTQPALFVIEYALAKLWLEWGIRPAALIGHSVGEYVAACLAGVFSVNDALRLVARRGQFVQGLPQGAMLSVALSEQEAQPLLNGMEIAAVNSPQVTVLAGTIEAAARCQEHLTQRGIACRLLNTSHAFHSRVMDPMLEAFAAEVAMVERNPPRLPYISNVTGEWVTAEQAIDPWFWATHLRQTVRFSDGIRTILASPDRVLLEVGPGHTLTTLARQHRQADKVPAVLPTLPHASDHRSPTETMVTALGQLWLAGAQPDWAGFHRHQRRHRVALPTYPFERQRYWIEPFTGDKTSNATTSGRLGIDDWLSAPVWKQTVAAPLLPRRGPTASPERCLLFCDAQGPGARLADRLSLDGYDVIRVLGGPAFARRTAQEYVVNPSHRDDYDRLMAELRLETDAPGMVVHSWAASGDPDLSFDEIQDRTFYSLLFLTQAWTARGSHAPLALFAVSTGLHQVVGDERLDAAKATLLGLCQVVAQEHPGILCRSVDIDDSERDAAFDSRAMTQLISELGARSTDPVVAYRHGRRWVRSFDRVPSQAESAPPSRLRNGGVYLITGGLGELGRACAEYIARRSSSHLILVGRSALPDRTRWQEWLDRSDAGDQVAARIRGVLSLEEIAPTVTVETADVADLKQMASVVSRALDRWGRVDGVVHAAGVTTADAFGPIAQCTRQSCERLFAPKTRGVLVLDEVFRRQPPDFFLLFSSLSAVLGGLHLGAYASANCFMDAFAAAKQGGHATWTSVNWDAWRPESQTADPAGEGWNDRLPAIRRTEASDAFDRVFALGALPQIVVSTTDLQTRIDRWVTPGPAVLPAADAASAVHHARPALAQDYIAPGTEMEEQIASLWSGLLGVDRVGARDNFFELGGHSLLAIQLLSRLRDGFGIELPVQALFDQPTVGEFAAAVSQATGLAADERKKVAALLDLVEALPDEEVTRRLAEQTASADRSALLADPAKERTRQFYDDVNRQLNASPAAGFSEFLNFGYVPEPLVPESGRRPNRALNDAYSRLVAEVIGGCALQQARVLDVGCGRGGTVRLMATGFGARQVIGVDLSPVAIAYCRAHHAGIPAVFINADAEHLPFADGSFDVVTNIESSHSYSDVARFYSEVRRLLRADGYFLYADLFSADALPSLHDQLEDAGFVLEADRDVTRQVVNACDQRATRHLELVKGTRSNATMRDFLGAPGSEPYVSMVTGRASYRVVTLRARFVESVAARVPRVS